MFCTYVDSVGPDLVFIECYAKFYFIHKYRVRVDVNNFNLPFS